METFQENSFYNTALCVLWCGKKPYILTRSMHTACSFLREFSVQPSALGYFSHLLHVCSYSLFPFLVMRKTL